MDSNKRQRILVVEDDEFLRDLYHELLDSDGFVTEVAVDGLEGLEKMKAGGWDLILLDIMLPKMDGLEILKELRSIKAARPNGPIVMLTNLGNDNTINQAFLFGAQGYLIKSALNPDQVLSEVHNFLNPAQKKSS